MRPRAIGALGLLLGLLVRVVAGQGVVSREVNDLTHQMAEQVRRLAEDFTVNLGQAPAGAYLVQDTQELALAIDEFHRTIHGTPDLNQARQAFAGIDGTWQHLRTQLARPGVTTPGMARAAGQIDVLAAQIRQGLGLNDPPPGFYGSGPPPSGIGETRRLAHALVDRAEDLARVVQAEVAGNPNGAGVVRDAADLARAADVFHDTLDVNQPVTAAAQAFGPVDVLADRVEPFATSGAASPRLQAAWQAFASVEILIHQNLGLPSRQPTVALTVAPPADGGPSPLVAVADELVAQSNAYLQAVSHNSPKVPERELILIDARRLFDAAVHFRQAIDQGLDANRLAYEFRDVDASWRRMSRRVYRIAKGRTGPNIAEVGRLGTICEQIHRVLGMPGYPPSVAGYP